MESKWFAHICANVKRMGKLRLTYCRCHFTDNFKQFQMTLKLARKKEKIAFLCGNWWQVGELRFNKNIKQNGKIETITHTNFFADYFVWLNKLFEQKLAEVNGRWQLLKATLVLIVLLNSYLCRQTEVISAVVVVAVAVHEQLHWP